MHTLRSVVLLPLLVAAFLPANAALAAPATSSMMMAATPSIEAFDQARFDAAQAADKPILVWVHAPWCPVCREQEKLIKQVAMQPAYRDLVILRIDYDTQKPLWQKFGATQQSTLIAFHGRRETGRSAHETQAAVLEPVIRSSLGMR